MIFRKFQIILLLALFFLALSACKSDKKSKIPTTKQTPKNELKKTEQKPTKNQKPVPLNFDTYEGFYKKYLETHKQNKVKISTQFGEIVVKLYDNTPNHKANFLYLTERGFFNTTVFYRVISNFIIQGGNSDSWETSHLKAEIGNFKMKPEILPENFHKRGALAAARSYTDNPDKLSSPYTFYIVQRGQIKPEGIEYLRRFEDKIIPENQAEHYIKYGGSPSLDGEHTVFGEVISGMEVVDKIANVKTDDSDWPIEQVYIKSEIIN